MKKRSQVWIETVIYTLVALVIIGLFLSFAKPKVDEIQDKAIIDQSVEMLNALDLVMQNIVEKGVGNQRVPEIGIKKGVLKIDSINDQLIFEMESKYAFTEPGQFVRIGNIIAYSEKKGSLNRIKLISNYSNYNITYNGLDQEKTIPQAPVSYKLSIANKGGNKVNIDFLLI